jgi:hypothetical protein
VTSCVARWADAPAGDRAPRFAASARRDTSLIIVKTLDRRRFWTEIGLGAASFVLLVLTAAWPEWIEAIFGVEPDGGSGALEWALVAVLALCACALPWHGVHGLRRTGATAVGSQGP